jgi:hypothetical protein
MLEQGTWCAPEGAKKILRTEKNDRNFVFLNFDMISRNFDSLSVFGNPTLCKRKHAIFRAWVQLYTRAYGHAGIPVLLIPSADIEWC